MSACLIHERPMPRRRPAQVRIAGALCASHDPALHRVQGVPARVHAAIVAVEHGKMAPGEIRTALWQWKQLAKRGLAYPCGHCGEISCCGDSPRRVLEEAISYLPPWAKKHLRRVVQRLDRIYLDQVWPDPDVVLPPPGPPLRLGLDKALPSERLIKQRKFKSSRSPLGRG